MKSTNTNVRLKNSLMDANLLQLILLFKSEVRRAIEILQLQSGLSDYMDWRVSGMERSGTLGDQSEYSYEFHGIGCLFTFANGQSIDWDRGHKGRNDGFDLWRLNLLREERAADLEIFEDAERLEVAFIAAVNSGSIVSPWRGDHDNLFYLAEDIP